MPDPTVAKRDAPASPLLLGAVDFLLALKDGDRDDYYHANKDYAWKKLREAADIARSDSTEYVVVTAEQFEELQASFVLQEVRAGHFTRVTTGDAGASSATTSEVGP